MVYYAVDFRLSIEDSFTHTGCFGVTLAAPDAAAAERQVKTRALHEARELYPLSRQIDVDIVELREVGETEYASSQFGLITD